MVSFSWYNMPKTLKPGESVRLAFRIYNDTSEELEVTVKVYQKEPSLKYIGSTTFKAYANGFTNHTSALTFTMPKSDVVLHAEFEATGVQSGKKYYSGRDWRIEVESVPQPENPVLAWDLQVDKTQVSPGEKVYLTARVLWEKIPGTVGVRFKLRISAFGKVWETACVSPTSSPAILKASVTVPYDVSPGTHTIKVTLLYEVY